MPNKQQHFHTTNRGGSASGELLVTSSITMMYHCQKEKSEKDLMTALGFHTKYDMIRNHEIHAIKFSEPIVKAFLVSICGKACGIYCTKYEMLALITERIDMHVAFIFIFKTFERFASLYLSARFIQGKDLEFPMKAINDNDGQLLRLNKWHRLIKMD